VRPADSTVTLQREAVAADAAPARVFNDDLRRRPHRLFRIHPGTGRKALYLDPGKIPRIEGLDGAWSDAIVDELTGRMIQPHARCRHEWSIGDVVIWDNRCSRITSPPATTRRTRTASTGAYR